MKKNITTKTVHRINQQQRIETLIGNKAQKKQHARVQKQVGKILKKVWATRAHETQYAFKMHVSEYITLRNEILEARGVDTRKYRETFRFYANPTVPFRNTQIKGFSKAMHPFARSARITGKEVTLYLDIEAIRASQKKRPLRRFVRFVDDILNKLLNS